MRAALFAVFGLILGSFLTVVVYRVPRREGVARGRSRCPSCGTEIRAVDNIPVFSWILLRGRCRACGRRVSPRYPLTEVATAALFAAASLAFPDLFRAILVSAFLTIL
ncbi:MAG TPA: prepilin peptidase, partial [Actinomycetota bacterium]|nr:prepilin peptidase [Actinomycetota bacterium]